MGPKVQSKGEASGFEKLKQLRHVGVQAKAERNSGDEAGEEAELSWWRLSFWTA